MPPRLIALMLLAMLLVACGGAPAATPPPPATDAPASADDTPALRPVTLAMSYIPNVQFAPYYMAAAQGYFAEEGLEVLFDYNFETDVVQRAASWPVDNVAFATASGTSTLLARQQDIPVKTVMTLYQEFPVVFFAKQATGLQTAADLVGKTVGIPGNFGESLYALLAMRYANDLDESAFPVEVIGFTQAQAVLEDKVQVGIGYGMNEPVLLRQQGEEVAVLRVADVYNLAANGIVVSERLLAEEPELARGFVRAALRGLQDTLDDPDRAFEVSLTFIPEAQLGDVALQRQVLIESLPYWHSPLTDAEGLGFTDITIWQRTEQFMRDAELLAGPVNVEQAFTNAFLP
ncbi:MAG: myristoyl transferase [Candidatus Viridilinea halotolerans]|uniref:Myristoyl transferase n=1 Tax=Candidatus Viridilinea halotolerans TaxID=2491704 RepID=A0A426U969_9CHLR|nr:MAG: myristoyl transferase [Candidatus Viridilinea halotolerans]